MLFTGLKWTLGIELGRLLCYCHICELHIHAYPSSLIPFHPGKDSRVPIGRSESSIIIYQNYFSGGRGMVALIYVFT